MNSLDLALRDGAILAVAASALIMGSLRANPRLFMRHFPDALKARLPPLDAAERRAGAVVGVGLMLLLFGGPLASAALAGPMPPCAAFVHAFVVGMIPNAVDWLVLDELWLGLLKPRWAIPPGATRADFLPFDHRRHARGFAVGTGLSAVAAGLATAALWAAGALG